MRVGALQETITVTGETPVVDVQSTKRETVLSQEVIAAIPATRTVGSLLNATPGLTVDGNGLAATPTMTFFSARGGQTNEGRMAVNGMTVAAAFNGGGVSSYILDSVNVDEVAVVVSGGLGESDIGGPTMNLVPRSGGNAFRGQGFFNNAGEWSKGSNLDDSLRAVGIVDPPGIIGSYDASVSYRRPDQARPAVVLRQLPQAGYLHDRRGHRRQRQCLQRRELAVGAGRQPRREAVAGTDDVHRPPDGAGYAEEPLHVRPRISASLRGRARSRWKPMAATPAAPTGFPEPTRPPRPRPGPTTSISRTT